MIRRELEIIIRIVRYFNIKYIWVVLFKAVHHMLYISASNNGL